MTCIASPLIYGLKWKTPAGWNLRGLINQAVRRRGQSIAARPNCHIRAAHSRGASMVDYSIAAIPTVYRGRQYRSRLEARWAAFFDELGWRHEYEPFDLGSWSPDFLLPDWNVLVEIKPLTEFDAAVWSKLVNASFKCGVLRKTSDNMPRGILLTRAAPKTSVVESCAENDWPIDIGWYGSVYNEFYSDVAWLAWISDTSKPVFTPQILSIEKRGWYTPSGNGDWWFTEDGEHNRHRIEVYHDHTMELWAHASNAVQYRKDAVP